MSPQESGTQQGAAYRPPLLSTKQVTKLTDAAMALFGTLYDLERAMKQSAKARLAAELDRLDVFGLTANKVNAEAEEYQPDDRDWCS
jgi:hypothetical protein